MSTDHDGYWFGSVHVIGTGSIIQSMELPIDIT